MRQLATIREIDEVQPIENADAIEKVRVGGWWCVAKKGEFAPGAPCVYFEIDSLLPSGHPAFAFLAERSREVTIALDNGNTASCYRLRTVWLRGQISQGLALPLAAVGLESGVPGTDVSDLIGVYKWEPPISKQMAALAFGPFPSFIPKTDEERVQNLSDTVAQHAGELFYVTEKLDGCSVTMYRTEERFGVCSRNWDLLEGNLYWNVARAFHADERLPVGYAIQGEIIGESIQGNPLKCKGQHLYVFNVYSIGDGRFLDFDEMVGFCEDRSWITVPVVNRALKLPSDVAEVITMADGTSLIAPSSDREGLVFRPLIETREEIRGGMSRLSFKAISNRYLLKEK
jgi:RNA ligase (TIGR02306 family)